MRYFFLFALLTLGASRVLAQDLTVTSLTLVNADTSETVFELTDGSIINFAELGTNKLSVVATTNPDPVGSVAFGFDGTPDYQVESLAPYTIAGDSAQDGATRYSAWTPSVGEHTLTATPYSEGGAEGTAGTPLTVRFTVIDEMQTATPPAADPVPTETEPATQAEAVTVTPTPAPAPAPTPAPATAESNPATTEGAQSSAQGSEPSPRLRQTRFEVRSDAPATFGGTVLAADYGLDQAVVTVLLSGLSSQQSYAATLEVGGCNGPAGEVALKPVDGRTGLSANAVALSYDALLDDNHYLGLYSSVAGQESVLSCTLLGR